MKTPLEEVIETLRGHGRAQVCTLEPKDCRALAEKLVAVDNEDEWKKAHAEACKVIVAQIAEIERITRERSEAVNNAIAEKLEVERVKFRVAGDLTGARMAHEYALAQLDEVKNEVAKAEAARVAVVNECDRLGERLVLAINGFASISLLENESTSSQAEKLRAAFRIARESKAKVEP